MNPAIVQARFSDLNHVATATVTAPEQAGYPASNIKTPQSPRVVWRAPNTAAVRITVDFGSPKLVEMIVLVRPEFPSLTYVLEATPLSNNWVSPPISVSYNQWSRVFQNGYLVSPGQTYRYLRVEIPSSTYQQLGGLWAGPLVAVPRDIRWEEQMITVEPVRDLQPDHQGWRQRLKMGDPYTVIRARRVAVNAAGAAAGANIELAHWIDLDARMWGVDAFAWYSNRGDPALAWIMRRVSETAWPIHQTVSESDLTLEEVMGP
jgi:hypothetical protein